MSQKVTFHFDPDLPHQADAIKSTVALFDGIPRNQQGLYGRNSLFMGEAKNPKLTVGTKLLDNVRRVQLDNKIFMDETLHDCHFGIEMETGTGKTYVYLRSILTLHQEYGFRKFLIVVPSVAILKGVQKTLEQLHGHFKTLHNADLSKHSFIYNSANLGRLKTFVETHDLDICVINFQSFNSAKTLIQKEQELGGEILWERIKDLHPIVIIDEPQKVEGAKKKPSQARLAINELEPLFELKYSATHRQEIPFNKIYSLDSFQAYDRNLVKRIRVKTVYGQVPKDRPYVRYVKFNKDLTAVIEIFHQEQGKQAGKIRLKTFRVENNADIHELSGYLSQYKGYRINAQPHASRPLVFTTPTGERELKEGESNEKISQEEAKRIQIRIAIECHFEKQFQLLDAGHDVKALTLFFIDDVSKVRDDTRSDGRGEYLRIFDEEYEAYLNRAEIQFKLNIYRDLFPKDTKTEMVREGYFARDKNQKIAELEYGRNGEPKSKSQEDIDRGIELILDKKDELITFAEPLAFIFSHSALREGWDNPNVFTLCTLKQSHNDIAKKQEIGRGLRLPVDIRGKRISDETVNVLTVIANDHYDQFAESLQNDFNEETGFNREEVTETILQNTLVAAGLPPDKITAELINAFRRDLIRKNIMSDKNILAKDATKILETISFVHPTLAEHEINIKKQFAEAMQQKGSRKLKIENGDNEPIVNELCKYVTEGEFNKILQRLTEHLTTRTLYKFQLDSKAFIAGCIRETNQHFAGHKLEYTTTVSGGDLIFESSGKAVAQKHNLESDVGTEYKITRPEYLKTDLQIVDHIMYHTMMPRLAILEIVRGFHNRDLLNSQDKLEEFTTLIAKALTRAKAEGVHAYEIIDAYKLDSTEILAADVIDEDALVANIKRVYQTNAAKKKAVHQYYNMDSNGEYDFAEQLDHDDSVELFTKLKKGGFIIDTPHGHYSPDWAIVCRQTNGHLRLYFIIETKMAKDWDDLTDVEKAKIKCGELHFKAVSNEIKFDWINSYKSFKAKIV